MDNESPPEPVLPEMDTASGVSDQSALELECYETFESLESTDSMISVELEDEENEDAEEDENAKPKISIAKPSSIFENSYHCTGEPEYDNYGDLIIEEVPSSPSPSLSSNFSPLYGEDVGQQINGELTDVDLEQHMDHLNNSEFLSEENKTDSNPGAMPGQVEDSQAQDQSKGKIENMTLEMLLDDKTFGQNRLRTSATRKKKIRRLAREIPNPIKTLPAKSITPTLPLPPMSMPLSNSMFPMPGSAFAINNQQQLTNILNANISNTSGTNAEGQQVQIVPILLLATVPVNHSTPPQLNNITPTFDLESQSSLTPKRRKLVHNCTSCPQTFATIQSKKEHMLRCHVGNNTNSAEFTPPPPPALNGLKRLGNLISATSLIKNMQQQKQQTRQENVPTPAHNHRRRVIKNLLEEYPRTPPGLRQRPLPSMPKLTPCFDFDQRNWNLTTPMTGPPPLHRISDSNSSGRQETRKTPENGGGGGASGCFLNLNDLLDKPVGNPSLNPIRLRNEFMNHFEQLRFGSLNVHSWESQLQATGAHNPPPNLGYSYLEEEVQAMQVKEEVLPTLEQELDLQFDF